MAQKKRRNPRSDTNLGLKAFAFLGLRAFLEAVKRRISETIPTLAEWVQLQQLRLSCLQPTGKARADLQILFLGIELAEHL